MHCTCKYKFAQSTVFFTGSWIVLSVVLTKVLMIFFLAVLSNPICSSSWQNCVRHWRGNDTCVDAFSRLLEMLSDRMPSRDVTPHSERFTYFSCPRCGMLIASVSVSLWKIICAWIVQAPPIPWKAAFGRFVEGNSGSS